MEWDAEGLVVASPPWALVAKDESFSSIFQDKEAGVKVIGLVLLQDTSSYHS